ncbi:MAG: glycosyltransferase family 39 protein [Chloroflexota bacterium]|nr:glycosyltransferase family 39 protein [Chloroflexota bacterium]
MKFSENMVTTSASFEPTATKPRREPSRAELEWLVLIILAACALRLVWVLTVHSGLGGYNDPQWYFGTAKNLASGNGMTIRVVPSQGYLPGPGGIQAIFWPQGYPLTLAAVFKVFGAGLTAGKLRNVFASTLVVPLVFLLARRTFGGAVALVAAALFAVYPANIFWTSVLFSDVVFTAPFAVATVLLVYGGARPTRA